MDKPKISQDRYWLSVMAEAWEKWGDKPKIIAPVGAAIVTWAIQGFPTLDANGILISLLGGLAGFAIAYAHELFAAPWRMDDAKETAIKNLQLELNGCHETLQNSYKFGVISGKVERVMFEAVESAALHPHSLDYFLLFQMKLVSDQERPVSVSGFWLLANMDGKNHRERSQTGELKNWSLINTAHSREWEPITDLEQSIADAPLQTNIPRYGWLCFKLENLPVHAPYSFEYTILCADQSGDEYSIECRVAKFNSATIKVRRNPGT